jgi:hypothetical protein
MSQDHFVKEPQKKYRNPFRDEAQKVVEKEQLLYSKNNGFGPSVHSNK